MPFAFAVVCEAAADFRTATGLAERIIRENFDWVDDHVLAGCPIWRGIDTSSPYLLWKDVKELARQANIRSHGHFGEQPAEPDAHAAQRALRLLKWKWNQSLDGILLIRDDDRDARRRTGLEQARKAEHEFSHRIVIGLAHCNRECWVLAGYDPAGAEEEDRLSQVRDDLGFDPRLATHQLTAKHDADKRSAKRVLSLLTQDDADRESTCWARTPLMTLEARGGESGLADFFQQIRKLLGSLEVNRSGWSP